MVFHKGVILKNIIEFADNNSYNIRINGLWNILEFLHKKLDAVSISKKEGNLVIIIDINYIYFYN